MHGGYLLLVIFLGLRPFVTAKMCDKTIGCGPFPLNTKIEG